MASSSVSTPRALSITLHEQSQVLEIGFDGGETFRLPFELLRIYSPSAEVKGHGQGQEVLQTGKRGVLITDIKPVGNYAVLPTFSDGHQTGIFSWDYLYFLGSKQPELWVEYEARLLAQGGSREVALSSRTPNGPRSDD
jgi:DUF971 family protein